MVSLFDDLRRVPTPLAVRSRGALVSLVKQAQVLMLRASLGASIGAESSRLSTDLRRFALWMEHAAFVDGYMEDSILEVTSALYEYAADLTGIQPTTIYRPPLNGLLRSAIAASSSSFTGKATVVGGRIDNYLRSRTVNSDEDRHQLLVARCIVSFVSRKFQRSFALAEASGRLFDTFAQNNDDKADYANGHPSRVAQSLVAALDDISLGLLIGELDWVDKGLGQLETVVETAATTDDAFNFWLSNRLLVISRAMSKSSMHRNLGYPGSPIPRRYRHLLAGDGFLELWSPQMRAISEGILDSDNVDNIVVSIPTGAGKTLIAELLILSMLSDDISWAVYLVPSRALVNQVSQDLKRRLRAVGIKIRNVVAGPEQSVIVGEEMDLLGQTHTVVVMTPEKLDTYVRTDISVFADCRLLILDEAHIVSDFTRGALTESLVARFMIANPMMKIVVLSGVMSNTEDFTAWLGAERTRVVSEPRRPTRQTYGIAIRQDPPLSVGPEVVKHDKKFKRDKITRRVEFKGGLVLVNESDDLAGDIDVDVANLFSGHMTVRKRGLDLIRDTNESRSAITDHTRQIAESYAAMPGTILVFLNNIDWVESVAAKTNIVDGQYAEERRRLSEFVALELGSDHSLVGICARGIGFHHARLPLSVQRAIEYALSEGWLKVVYATPTLREGVNTSASTVILGGLVFRNGPDAVPMSVMNFANVAGRAGRPRRETAGQIVLVPDELSTASAVDAGQRYVLSGADARRVESQLGRLQRSLAAADEVLEDLPVEDQRLVLGILASGISSTEELSVFVDNTLWAVQETDHEDLLAFVKRTNKALTTAESKFGARLNVAAKSSLALSSAELIRDHVEQSKELFAGEASEGDRLIQSLLRSLITVGLNLEEMRSMIRTKNMDPNAHLSAVMAWVDGRPYRDILAAGKDAGLFKPSDKVGSAVKYCADASNWLSWVAGAAWIISDAELDEVDPLIGTLPLLIKHGVPDLVGAYIAILGVSDRNAILQLSTRFALTGQNASIEALSDWLDSLNLDEAFPSAEHFLRADLLRRQSFGLISHEVPFVFATFVATARISRGTRVKIERVEKDIFLSLDGLTIGQVTEQTVGNVMNLWLRHAGNVFAMTTSSLSQRSVGVLVVIPL